MAKKKLFDENGNQVKGKIKKPFYKKVWFWIVAIVLIAIIGGSIGGEETTNEPESDTTNTEVASNTEVPKEEANSELKDQYDAIVIGDLMGGGDGVTYESVVEQFGEPDSTSDSEIEGMVTKLATWTGLEGGNMMSSLSVSFTDNKAVSKAISGLEVSGDKTATLEQFNNVATDGSYTFEQAVTEFGEPDSYSETLINGTTQNMAMWTANVQGEIGANFNITFENDAATAKSHFGMK